MPPPVRCVTFTSERFEQRTPAPHFINPTNFGEDLAGWLRDRLPAELAPDVPIQEDYGWGIWTRSGEDQYWIAIGLMDEAEGEEPRTWLVTAASDPGLNILKRLFHRPRPENLDAVCQAIDDALHGEPAIAEIQWWNDQPFHGAGTPHPSGRAPQ